jgi:Uma2 family endonuclease
MLRMSSMMRSSLPIVHKSPAVSIDDIWRLRVDQYHAMIRTGILTEDDPVELLEGWLVVKMPQNPPHRVAIRLIYKALEAIVPTNWYIDSQAPITTADSEPEPDLMVVRGDPRQYLDRHPIPQDLALVVEVADTSIQRDRAFKKRLYAAARIPVYWILNLPESSCEASTDPSGPGNEPDYQQRQNYGPTEEIPLMMEGVEVGRLVVQALLP